jgi:hypothetical protein
MGYSGASEAILDVVSGSVNAGFDDLNITVYAAWGKDGNRVPELEYGDELLPLPDADKPSAITLRRLTAWLLRCRIAHVEPLPIAATLVGGHRRGKPRRCAS